MGHGRTGEESSATWILISTGNRTLRSVGISEKGDMVADDLMCVKTHFM